MARIQYEIIEIAQPIITPRDLINISGDRNLVASLKAFGPGHFSANIKELKRRYSHPKTGEIITFREPTTAESILIASCGFKKMAKRQILDSHWLQTGRIIRAEEGVFANPPKDAQGNSINNERILKSYLKGTKPIKVRNGKIYIVSNRKNLRDFGYAEYETFKQEEEAQEGKEFAECGLARVLEHTEEKIAKSIWEIANPKIYPLGVYVHDFDRLDVTFKFCETPISWIASLTSIGNHRGRRLDISGNDYDNNYLGCIFGVLDKKSL